MAMSPRLRAKAMAKREEVSPRLDSSSVVHKKCQIRVRIVQQRNLNLFSTPCTLTLAPKYRWNVYWCVSSVVDRTIRHRGLSGVDNFSWVSSPAVGGDDFVLAIDFTAFSKYPVPGMLYLRACRSMTLTSRLTRAQMTSFRWAAVARSRQDREFRRSSDAQFAIPGC